MDLAQKYSELTGFNINNANQARILAAIEKTQIVLEDLLGYTLDKNDRLTNQVDGLSPTYAYRRFPLRHKDTYQQIDPCTSITTIKLYKNGSVEDTLDSDEFTSKIDRGYITKFTLNETKILNYTWYPFHKLVLPTTYEYEWVIDANWGFANNQYPDPLLIVWAEFVTYFAKRKKDIRSESLGGHSYTKFEEVAPQKDPINNKILRRYAGPRGTINVNPTF